MIYRNNKILLTLTFLFVIHTYVFAQHKQVVQLLKQAYESGNNFQVSVHYNLYKGNETNPVESYNGIYYRKGQYIYSKIGKVEIISTPSFYLRINPDQKAILISESTPENVSQLNNSLLELMQYVDVDKFYEQNNSIYLKLKAKKITQLPFSSIELVINKQTHLLIKVEYYYFTQINFSQDAKKADYAQPRLEVIYSNYKNKNIDIPRSKFKLFSFVSFDGKKYHGLGKFSEYQIINQRKQKNNR